MSQTHLCLSLQLLLDLAAGLDALQYVLAVLVELQLGDDDLRGVDTDGDGGSGRLLLDDTLDVDDVLETVDGSDLALAALVGASDDQDFVILSDWDGADLGRLLKRYGIGRRGERTLYLSRSSLLRGALMIVRLTLEGAS